MKIIAASLLALIGSASAFAPAQTGARASSGTGLDAFSKDSMPGALQPMGFFDPWGLADKADEKTLKRYREAEITHGRVSMLAVVGFLVGERVAGSTVLFDGKINGPAIDHFLQLDKGFWATVGIGILLAEKYRAMRGFVPPEEVPVDQPGLLRPEYTPGDLGFDPLGKWLCSYRNRYDRRVQQANMSLTDTFFSSTITGLMPTDPQEFFDMQTKELQNGRLAMLAAAGK